MLLLSSCADIPNPRADFLCKDKREFSIEFLQGGDEAHLAFAHVGATEILANERMASGILYSNDRYIFMEHQGKAMLQDTGKAKSVACRKLPPG